MFICRICSPFSSLWFEIYVTYNSSFEAVVDSSIDSNACNVPECREIFHIMKYICNLWQLMLRTHRYSYTDSALLTIAHNLFLKKNKQNTENKKFDVWLISGHKITHWIEPIFSFSFRDCNNWRNWLLVFWEHSSFLQCLNTEPLKVLKKTIQSKIGTFNNWLGRLHIINDMGRQVSLIWFAYHCRNLQKKLCCSFSSYFLSLQSSSIYRWMNAQCSMISTESSNSISGYMVYGPSHSISIFLLPNSKNKWSNNSKIWKTIFFPNWIIMVDHS